MFSTTEGVVAKYDTKQNGGEPLNNSLIWILGEVIKRLK